MPLSSKGQSILQDFIKRYGKKGKGYFFAKENKDKKFAATVKKK